jgi:putative DNA primase/helicase
VMGKFDTEEDPVSAPPPITDEDFPADAKPQRINGEDHPGLLEEDEEGLLPAAFSDDALADEWVKQHGKNWRYVEKWASWYRWNETYWLRVQGNKHFDLARILTRQALLWPDAGTLSKKEKRIVNSASMAAGVLRQVKVRASIEATVEQWDADQFMLATPEGVIDLHAGKMIEASREQYCTRCTSVAPQPGIPQKWLQCLERWFGGDADLIQYAQLFAGYCCTGDTREKMFLFIHGPSDTGKSTFVEVLMAILGTYAQAASMDTFAESKYERHSTELAELSGVRFVAAPETEEGTRWNQSRINAITGKDRIRARFMRQDNFEFTPRFKLLVYGNNTPHIRNVDGAMRRRLHILPFPHSIPREEQDSLLDASLRHEYPQILQWMIQGCLNWQACNGLTMPEAVNDATQQYLEAEDSFGGWVDERLVRDISAFGIGADVYRDYRAYCEGQGDAALGSKRFAQQMEQRGFMRGKSKEKRGFSGCRVKLLSDT